MFEYEQKFLLIKENIRFLIQNLCGSIIIIGKKYLIDNSKAYSEHFCKTI